MDKQQLQEKMISLSFEIANISQSIQVYENVRNEKLVIYHQYHQQLKEILQNEIEQENSN